MGFVKILQCKVTCCIICMYMYIKHASFFNVYDKFFACVIQHNTSWSGVNGCLK